MTFPDVSVDQAGEYNHTVASPGDQATGSLTVESAADEPAIDDVVLDSVSSLLDTSMQPLTDDSITAIEAEPTASNTDADGNGDAVSYPDDVDIPVTAVDGGVVGITGPFVTTDTEFANYSNEEILLNLYDELLGGSGTVLHDEGHGQFYTLAPNGGDDFQAFAEYAESNGYTYDNTTDIAGDIGNADAVVITTPPEAFTQSELDALSTFVADGGVVFLHDQSDYNDFDATANHNEIASALGADFRFNDDQVVDDQNNTGVSFVPTTGNFNEATFPALFEEREGLGFDLDVNGTYEVDVVSVADGDTADVAFSDGTVESVRILGIDTPETGGTPERLQEYEGIDDGPALKDKADEATAYAESRLADTTVNLTFDSNEGLRDVFGRLLGVLELPDGSVYNEEIVTDGLARVYDSGFGDHDKYLDFERQARANDSGIWNISEPATTSEVRDDPVSELFFPDPVAVTGPEIPVSSENGESLVALDSDANVAAIGGPLVEEQYEAGEGGPGIDQYEVFPFLTNVVDALGNGTGSVLVDGGHGQFSSDFAVSAEDTAYYMRYLEGQSPGTESFIGLEGVVNLTSDAGPGLLDGGQSAARALLVSTPTSEFSSAERTAVANFADAGGAVVLFGSAVEKTALSNFDPLLSELDADVGFTETSVTDSTNNLDGDSSIPTTSNFDDGQFPGLFTAYTSGESAVPFEVSDIVPADATVAEGEAFNVSATVTNEGTESDEQTVELRLEPAGSAVRTRTVQLDPAQSTTVTFPDVSVDQAGEYNHTVATSNDTASGTLTVSEPAAFSVAIVETNTPVEGETLEATVAVENVGGLEDTQPIVLDVGALGSVETNVTLGGGNATQVAFAIETGAESAGEYTATVTSTDDSDSTNVTVLSPSNPVGLELEPTDGLAAPDGATTFDIVITGVDAGIGAYAFNVTVNDTAVAAVEDFDLDRSTSSDSFITPDGKTLVLGVDLGGDPYDSGQEITVGTVDVAATGSTNDSTAVGFAYDPEDAVEGTNGTKYTVASDQSATFEVGLPPLPGFGDPPLDPDGDGRYEDVNGDGLFDIFDIQDFFTNLESDPVQNNVWAYDFDSNGGVDIFDVQALFDALLSD